MELILMTLLVFAGIILGIIFTLLSFVLSTYNCAINIISHDYDELYKKFLKVQNHQDGVER